MRKAADKKSSTALILVCTILIFALFGYFNKQKTEILNENKCYAIGNVTQYAGSGFVYEFEIMGKNYSGRYGRAERHAPFKNKNFIVVYKCDDPEMHTLLVFPRDFKIHNEVFPDSMRWVLPYYE